MALKQWSQVSSSLEQAMPSEQWYKVLEWKQTIWWSLIELWNEAQPILLLEHKSTSPLHLVQIQSKDAGQRKAKNFGRIHSQNRTKELHQEMEKGHIFFRA